MIAAVALAPDEGQRLPSRFDRALARYLYALDRLRATTDDSDENCDMLTDALTTAERDLMAEPAADIRELRAKADILWDCPSSTPPEELFWQFFKDLRRLTDDAPSITFHPAGWLERFERRGGGWIVRGGEAFILWPVPEDVRELLDELETRGDRAAVLDLIRAREAERRP